MSVIAIRHGAPFLWEQIRITSTKYVLQKEVSAMERRLEEYTQEELIEYIKTLKKQKKFGLVWEDKPEKVVKECETKLPVLKEVDGKAIENAPGEPTNIIIEGDNYHALSVLNYTHAGKIDVIYIDPPYNTGNKDFIYNDCYVDKEDTFRHSKWLSFMEKRLKLAKNLLADDGVIFISIDDNEQASLKQLCDSIFGENNVETLIWNKIGTGSSSEKMKQVKRARRDHEYIICCYANQSNVVFKKVKMKRKYKQKLVNKDSDPRGEYKLGSLARSEALSNKKSKNYYTVTSPTGVEWTRQFLMPKDEFEKLDKDNRIFWGKNGDKTPAVKIFASEKAELFLSSLLLDYGSATLENKRLCQIFNTDKTPFDNPKPVILIKTVVGLLKNDARVLDFFAGSGTTGQAVMELNKEDGGHRQFILVTNNEANGKADAGAEGIAEKVTYPRIKTVITGIRPDGTKYSDGIPANLRYFKTDFVEKGKTTDDTREALMTECCDMIRIREDAFEHVASAPEYRFYKNDKVFVPIIFDQFAIAETWELVEELNTEKLPVHCYNFSYNRHANEEEIPEDTELEWTACSIPETVLEVYRKIFRKKEV